MAFVWLIHSQEGVSKAVFFVRRDFSVHAVRDPSQAEDPLGRVIYLSA
jgi:hypothetical protein